MLRDWKRSNLTISYWLVQVSTVEPSKIRKQITHKRQQIWYAYALKNVSEGWNENLRKQFFSWYAKSRNFKGGASFEGFLNNFRNESLSKIQDANLRAEMDSLSKKQIALVPEGFEDARILKVGAKPEMKFDIEKLEAKAGEMIGIEFILSLIHI